MLLRVARRLTQALAGDELVRSELRWGSRGGVDLTGSRVRQTVSYGKHLLTRFDSGHTLRTHLRMDGTWEVRRTRTPPEGLGRPRIRAVLATAKWTCIGHQLGMLDLVRTADEHRLIGHLGPDLMAEAPDLDRAVANLLAQGERPIGEVLLDQRVAAGIGTIYLAETLWAHRISPWRPSAQVEDPGAVFATAARLMRRSADALELTATGDLAPGRRTHVHARDGRLCRRCRAKIAVAPVGAAPTDRPGYYCPECQTR